MSFISKIGCMIGTAALALVGKSLSTEIQRQYPSPIQLKPIGTKVKLEGREVSILGYTGHHEATFSAIKNRKKDLYFADHFLIAQSYAYRNGKASSEQAAAPAVGVVVTDKPFDGNNIRHTGQSLALKIAHEEYVVFKPISAEGQHLINARIMEVIPINAQNRRGLSGSLGRMKIDIATHGMRHVLSTFAHNLSFARKLLDTQDSIRRQG